MSNTTIHKTSTSHKPSTPHKYPTQDGGTPGGNPPVDGNLSILGDLSVQLYPTGRAWYRPENGTWEQFHKAINQSFLRLIQDGNSLIEGTLPDNENFTTPDATLWEYRLGLITNTSTDLEVRKASISRKLGHPNNIKARQHPLFIQSQLQLSGFNVWVHENTISYQTPAEIIGVEVSALQHGEPAQHGNSTQGGGTSFDVIANSVEEVESFAVGIEGIWATFFIGGEILGSVADVPYSRLREFKELVIKLKPAHTVAFTFINYI